MILKLKTLVIALCAFVFIASPAHAKQTKHVKQQKVIRIAKKYLGVHYVWGGSSPRGFDCSGLVRYVFAKINIYLPHYAAWQYNYGRYVPKEGLKPGDLVFFHNLGHVGIYVGDNKFIHSPNSGDRVKVSLLSSYNNYYGAKRLI
jgi:cell wall-associated NlpC family hydrolase